MPKGKILRKLQEKYEVKNNCDISWQNFLQEETYLIFSKKQYFLDTLEKLTKSPRIFWFYFKLRRQIKEFKFSNRKLCEKISHYNEYFIIKRLNEYSSFFDGKDDNLKYSLDHEQRRAIVKDDKHNLVVAGAGSGKTSVLTA